MTREGFSSLGERKGQKTLSLSCKFPEINCSTYCLWIYDNNFQLNKKQNVDTNAK